MIERIEKLLPAEYGFEATIREFREVLEEDIAERVKKNNGDIIDTENELNSGFLVMYYMCKTLVDIDMQEADVDSRNLATTALYRGAQFGVQISKDVESQQLDKLSIGEYIATLQEDAPLSSIAQDVGEYLAERPSIDALIGQYIPELDPSSKYPHLSELGAGLMLMMCERVQAENYLREAAKNLSPSDFTS